MSESLIPSFLVSDVSESLRSLTKNERCERIAQVAHQKWATMSDSLRLLRGNERLWANCSGRSPKMSKWVNRSFFSELLLRSFLGKKQAICLENGWAKSQPWYFYVLIYKKSANFQKITETLKINILFKLPETFLLYKNTIVKNRI